MVVFILFLLFVPAVVPARAAIFDVEVHAEIESEAAASNGEGEAPERDDDVGPEAFQFTSYSQQVSSSASSKYTTASASAQQTTTLAATAESLTISSSASTSIVRGLTGDETIDFGTGGGGVTSFDVSFCTDERVSYSISGFVRVETTGDTGSSESQAIVDANESIIDADAEDDPGDPRSITLSKQGVLDPNANTGDLRGFHRGGGGGGGGGGETECFYVSLFTISTVGNTQAQSRTSWSFDMQVVTNPAPPPGDQIRWVGGPAGAWSDPDNWNPRHVPILDDTRSDTAQILAGGEVAIDLAAAPAISTRAFDLTRRTGRLIVRVDPLRILEGQLVLDALSPDEPSLEVSGSGGVELDTGGIRARHAVIGQSVSGSVTVKAPEGAFETVGRCAIGTGGEGTLRVEPGGFVATAETLIGHGTRAGHGIVLGPNATWLTGNIAVGDGSDGDLSIAEGGLVTSDQAYVDRLLTGIEQARVLVQSEPASAMSEWNVNRLQVRGRGQVEVAARGLVHSNGDVSVGPGDLLSDSSGTGKILVHGGRLEAAGKLIVGDNGAGQVDVDAAGRVDADGALVIGQGAATGSLSVVGPSTEEQVVSESVLMPTNQGAIGNLSLTAGGRMLTQGLVEIGTRFGRGVATIDGDSTEPLDHTRWRSTASLLIGRESPAPADEFVPETGILSLADGTFEAIGGTVDVRRTGAIRGAGLGQILRASGGVTNNGVITGPLIIQGNYLGLPQGTIGASVSTPGFSGGAPLRRLAHDLLQSPAAVRAPLLQAEPGGTVRIEGAAQLDGRLVLQFYDGYAPSQGDTFPLIEVTSSVTGAFTEVEVRGLAPGATFDQQFTGSTFTLVALNDALPLPIVSLSAKPKLSEKKKAGTKVKVTRNGDLSAPMLVRYATGGTAVNGADYAFLPGAIEIPAGKATATIIVRPLADRTIEGLETIELQVVAGDDYTPSLESSVVIALQSKDKLKLPKKRK